MGGYSDRVGGVADHVHLVSLKATHCLADFMRELKKASSAWVHEEIWLRSFVWQEGYAAFTVSATSRKAVQHYIDSQEEHHCVWIETAATPDRGRDTSVWQPEGSARASRNPRLMAGIPAGWH